MANIVIIVLGIVLAIQANLAYELAVPVFKQPFGNGGSHHIIDGETAKKGQFPHQAAMTIDDSYFCGGALISKSWVLTAGHCVGTFRKWAVVLGAQNIKDPSEEGRIVITSNKGILHDGYDLHTIANDVGVVSLPKDVDLNNQINIIPMPPLSFKDKNFEGTVVRVSGWGKTSDGSGLSDNLQYVDLKIAAVSVCEKEFGDIPDKIYCGLGEGQKSPCNGDSGGALTIGAGKNLTHLGIVSFGSYKGCSLGYPMGFTSTPEYVEWISNKTGVPLPNF